MSSIVAGLIRRAGGIMRLFVPLFVVVSSLPAQERSPSGSIAGRVYNPSSGEYVYRAEITLNGSPVVTYTETDGSYVLHDVQAGPHVVSVRYTGYQPASAELNVETGKTSTQDFSISPAGYTTNEPVKLDRFTVTAAREGNAKSIMEERAAKNFKNVLSADSFGENPDDNVGEFLKLMPGVTIDYAFIQARGVRIAGMDPKYASLTMDGNSIPSGNSASFDDSNRAVELDAVSFVGIESVEANKTLTADMPADAAAGNINLRSKNAFDRKGRQITLQASMTANSYALTLARTPGRFGNEESVKTRPHFQVSYGDVFFNHRLGIQATLSYGDRWQTRDYQTELYDYSALGTAGPRIRRLQFASNSGFSVSKVMGLNADFKATDNLVLSLRSSYSQRVLTGAKRQWNLQTATKDLLPGSNLTTILTKADGKNTFLTEGGQVMGNKYSDTLAISPRFRYTLGRSQIFGGIDYSNADAEYSDMANGFFSVAIHQLTSMNWSAQRSSPDSTDWIVTQNSGRPWNAPQSFNADAPKPANIGSRPHRGVQEKMSGYVNASIPLNFHIPVTLRTGVLVQEGSYKLSKAGAINWTYVGPTGSQTSSQASLPQEIYDTYDGNMSSQVWGQHWPNPDRRLLYQVYLAHPEFFQEDTVNNFEQALTYPRSIREQVDAAYIRADASIGNLQLQGGVRYEKTRTTAHLLEQIPAATVAAERPDLKPGTIPYILYQYHDGAQATRNGEYENVFYSGGAKYRLFRNLDLQVSASEAITRPDYGNLAGAISVSDVTEIVTVPNPDLKPELSTKYYGGVSFYIEPAGKLSVGTYYLEFTDLQLPGGRNLTQEEAGYSGYPEYNGYTFVTTTNSPVKNQNRGVEVEYVQQLVFLPGPLKGLSVYGSMSRVIADQERIGVVNKFGAGGLAFRYGRVDARVNGTWQGPMMTSRSGATNKYLSARTALDFELGYKINDATRVYLSGRNVTDAPFKTFEINGGYGHPLTSSVGRYGSYWTAGVKCQF